MVCLAWRIIIHHKPIPKKKLKLPDYQIKITICIGPLLEMSSDSEILKLCRGFPKMLLTGILLNF